MVKRVPDNQILSLYNTGTLQELGSAAMLQMRSYHDPAVRSYIIDRNINYTDICVCRCKFCAFNRVSTAQGGFELPYDKIYNKIAELRAIGGNQILMQGGLNPNLTLGWHCKLLSDIKRDFPGLHIHAYSPPEILFFAKESDKSIEEVTSSLCDAGLDSIPGGGAEILVDSIRKRVSPAKCSTDEWLAVMRAAHKCGVYTTATMMFGHVETREQRIEHLNRIRTLQDESLQRGRAYFTSFTAWPFQPGASPLSGQANVHLAGPVEYLRTVALARIYLDNIRNIQSSWVTMGPQIGQLSLLFGCNDLGSVMMEEKVVAAAGTIYHCNEGELCEMIRGAGFAPVRRNFYYSYV